MRLNHGGFDGNTRDEKVSSLFSCRVPYLEAALSPILNLFVANCGVEGALETKTKSVAVTELKTNLMRRFYCYDSVNNVK